MSGVFHFDGSGGPASYPALNSFTAVSAEAGVDSKDAPTSYSATAALVNIWNQSRSAEGGKRYIIPRKLELNSRQTTNTGATDFRLHFYRDPAGRWSSGGTLLTAYPLTGSEDADFTHIAADAQVYVGELTLSAASSLERVLWRTFVSNVIFLQGDKITIVWGGGGEIPVAPDPEFGVIHVPPMWLGPGNNLSIHELATGPQSADPKFQFNFWWEEVDLPA